MAKLTQKEKTRLSNLARECRPDELLIQPSGDPGKFVVFAQYRANQRPIKGQHTESAIHTLVQAYCDAYNNSEERMKAIALLEKDNAPKKTRAVKSKISTKPLPEKVSVLATPKRIVEEKISYKLAKEAKDEAKAKARAILLAKNEEKTARLLEQALIEIQILNRVPDMVRGVKTVTCNASRLDIKAGDIFKVGNGKNVLDFYVAEPGKPYKLSYYEIADWDDGRQTPGWKTPLTGYYLVFDPEVDRIEKIKEEWGKMEKEIREFMMICDMVPEYFLTSDRYLNAKANFDSLNIASLQN